MLLFWGFLVELGFQISARLLPEKLTIYTTLVGLLNARNYNFGGEFVEAMIRQLKESLKANNYNEAVYLVRFFVRFGVLRQGWRKVNCSQICPIYFYSFIF